MTTGPHPPRRLPRAAVAALLVLWAAGMAAGFRTLWAHGGAAGAPSRTAPARLAPDDVRAWLSGGDRNNLPAADSGVGGGAHTLLLFAHPRCPCTRASVAELNRLLTRTADAARPLRAVIVFVRPEGASPGWERTDLWDAARRLPGAVVLTDAEARLARRFDAKTSGQTLVYAPDGRLRFAGGITSGRGHEGDNAGRAAIAALVLGSETAADRTGGGVRRTAVFGCGLY